MKKTIAVLLGAAVLALAIFVSEGAMAEETAKSAGKAPKALVAQPAFDFGKVLEGQTVTHAYTIANQGDAPLKVMAVRTSCGCTTAKKPESIAPGAQDQIVVQGNTNGYGGRDFNKTIAVATDDPAQPSIELRLSGRVAAFARIEPSHIRLHGTAGDTLQAEATVTPASGYPFKIVKSTVEESLADKLEVAITERDGVFQVRVRNRLAQPGDYRGNILLTTDNDLRPQLTLYVTGRILAKAP